MGNKVNPVGMRLQVNRTWDSRWYADTKDYGDLLLEDLKIKDFIKKEAKQAGISRVIIERPHRKCRVTIHAARPGVIIGKKGADIEVLRKKLSNLTSSELHLNIVEVRKPELDAALVGTHFIVAEALGRVHRHAVAHAVPGAEGPLAFHVADRRARDPVLARRFLVRDDAVAVRVYITELRVGLPVAAFRAAV